MGRSKYGPIDRSFSWSIVAVWLVCSWYFLFIAAVDADELSSGNKIRTADQAVDLALRFTGFDQSSGFSREGVRSSARMTTFTDSMVPYEYDWSSGREAWSITFEGVIPDYPDEELRTPEHAKDFEVIIDAETGQLLKVVSRFEPKEWGIDYVPWEGYGRSFYGTACTVDLVPRETLPVKGLFELISRDEGIRWRGWGTSPSKAKEISAFFLLFSSDAPESEQGLVVRDKNPRAVWLMVLNNFEECPVSESETRLCPMRGSRLCDAETGQGVGVVQGRGAGPGSYSPPELR